MRQNPAGVRSMAWILTAAALAVPMVVSAQSAYPTTNNSAQPTGNANYWSSERMRQAVPPQMGVPGEPAPPRVTPQTGGTPGLPGDTVPGGGAGGRGQEPPAGQ